MKKKLLVALLALALVFGFAPVRKVHALTAAEFTVDAVDDYITDPVFAQAVVDQILADETFNLSECYNVLDALRNYNGTISYSSTEELINSIEGINYLQNALIELSNQNISDLRPVSEKSMITNGSGMRGKAIHIDNCPVRIWPDSLVDLESGTLAFPTPQYAEGNAVFAYDTTELNIVIVYDYENLTIDGSTTATRYEVTGPVTASKEKPEAGDTTAEFKIIPTAPGKALARNSSVPWQYIREEDPATLTVAYWYTLNAEIEYPVYVETEYTTKIGVELVKYSTDDLDEAGEPVEGAKPLAGAKYELYKVGEEAEMPALIGTYTTTDAPLVIDGLEPGEYFFVEVEAPAGYKLDETPLYFDHEGVEEFKYNASGLRTEITVVKDGAKFYPQWKAGQGEKTNPYDLKAADTDYQKVQAGAYSSELKECVGFVKNGETVDLKLVEGEYSPDMLMTSKFYVNGTETEDVNATINEMLKNNEVTGPINIKVVSEFNLSENYMDTCVGKDEPITIWVENSTENDEGGTVNVKGCPEDTISSSKVYENTPREMNNVVEGQADKENNWYVVVEDIKVGPMGADGVSGATYTVVEQPQDEEGLYIITLDDESVIKVKLEYDQENEHVVVTIVDMDQNIDIAIPFARKPQPPVPITGDSSKTIVTLVGTMLASAAAIGYVVYSKKRDEE